MKKYKFDLPNYGAIKCLRCKEPSAFVCMLTDGKKDTGLDMYCVNCNYYSYYKKINEHVVVDSGKDTQKFLPVTPYVKSGK